MSKADGEECAKLEEPYTIDKLSFNWRAALTQLIIPTIALSLVNEDASDASLLTSIFSHI